MLRKSKPLDWDKIKAIYINGINTHNATFERVENIKDYAYWISSKIEESCFVYELDDEVVGWASLSPVSSRCVYSGVAEISVYVDPTVGGRGIGSQLLSTIIDYAEQNNIWTIQAGIFPENESSIALHQKFGFRKVGYREKIGQMDGIWRDNVFFERRSKTIV